MTRRPISSTLRAQVLSRDGYRCRMCGARADDPGIKLQVDHVVPVDQGGTDDLDNLAALCQLCNRGKSNLTLSDYRSLNLIPDGVRDRFKFYHDPKTGDVERFHLYLYYTDCRDSWPRDGEKFHREWIISGSEWDTSPDREALAARRRAEEEEKFEQDIRRELAGSGSRLILNERGLERVRG